MHQKHSIFHFSFFSFFFIQYTLGAIFRAIFENQLRQSMKNLEEMVRAASMEF